MEEDEMAHYLTESWNFSLPVREDDFALQPVNYMDCYNIENTFPNWIPGTHNIMLVMHMTAYLTNWKICLECDTAETVMFCSEYFKSMALNDPNS